MIKKVDIIIPVYNAFEDLCICVDSIQRNTDLQYNRLILVNDCSPDERIYPYLENCRRENILVIHNKENRGFSANINTGMEQSKENDVILLNSDTIVTKSWIEKLQACAYSNASIGTVTPVSNNATLCSVPVGFAENQLPEGVTAEEAAAVIEECSLREYPQLPVAHGFCMYVKREVVRSIGGFDAKTFQRGYGEENDFCCRAEQAGYIHVMCDDTYIYHSGTKSFLTKEKLRLSQEHERILKDRYPKQMRALEIYCAANPNLHIQKNAGAFLKIRNGKKNILYVLHADFKEGSINNIGGTQLHVRDMTQQLRNDCNVFVAARSGSMLQCTAYVGEDVLEWNFFIGEEEPFFKDSQRNLRKIFAELLDAFRIDLVHIQHFKGLSFDVLELAKERKIKVAATIHDFYLVCPNQVLLDDEGQYCRGICTQKCGECLRNKVGIRENLNYPEHWRTRVRQQLEKIDCFFFPSESAKSIFTGIYPEIAERSHVIEHGVELGVREDGTKNAQKEQVAGEKGQSVLHVAFIGGLSVEKGSRIITQIIRRGDRGIEWFTIGNIGDPELANLRQRNYTAVGKYDRGELPAIFEQYRIDIAAIISIWPETYSYTLSEAAALKKPVIVTDIGALGERVRKMGIGAVISSEHPVDSFFEAIAEFEDESFRKEIRSQIEKLQLPTLSEMADQYRAYYAALMRDRPTFGAYDRKFISDAMTAGRRQGEMTPQELEYYRAMRNSLTFQLVEKLIRIPFPFKVQLMEWIYRHRAK